MPLVLNRAEVESLLSMEQAIEAVEEAFREHHAGRVDMPVRVGVKVPEQDAVVLYMPAYIGGMKALGAKIVSVYPHNPARYKKPLIMATVLLNDAETGEILSIMDGTYLTAMRTGAVSGVASKYMARREASTVGIFGAGAQGRTQLLALCAVRKIRRAIVYDISPEASHAFAKEMEARLGIEVIPASEPRQAAENVDIISCATTSPTPVFEDEWLAEGTHINGVGSYTPEMQEIPPATVSRARVVVDVREAALKEAGDLIIPLDGGLITADHIYAELGEIVSGKPGRLNPKEITFFKSVGQAIQDVSTALKVYCLAKERGVGRDVAL